MLVFMQFSGLVMLIVMIVYLDNLAKDVDKSMVVWEDEYLFWNC